MKPTSAFPVPPPTPQAAVSIGGRQLRRGDTVRIRGHKGTFTFHDARTTTAGAIVCNFTGPGGFRSFYPDRITTITNPDRPTP